MAFGKDLQNPECVSTACEISVMGLQCLNNVAITETVVRSDNIFSVPTVV